MEGVNEMFQKNVKLVYKFWNRTQNSFPREEHEDVIQELLISFWRACQSYDPSKAKLSTYAYTFMLNTVRQLLRSFRSKKRQELIPIDFHDADGEYEEAYEVLRRMDEVGTEEIVLTRMDLEALPKPLIELALGSTSLKDLSKRWGVSEPSACRRVKKMKQKAVKQLQLHIS